MPATSTGALAERLADQAPEPGTAVELAAADEAKANKADVVRRAIEMQSEAIGMVLPAHVDPNRFSRIVMSAIKATPDLVSCFDSADGRTSVLLAAMQAATLGLEPNTPVQDCWILPRRRKLYDRESRQERWITEAQLSIGYRGYLKLARQSGTIETIYADVVRERDHFVWARGLDRDTLEHRPADGDRGEVTHAYAVARYRQGGHSFIVLNLDEIHARRAMSDSWKNEKARPYSPWHNWFDPMARKSALRALVPFLDLSPDVEQSVALDERSLRWADVAPGEAPRIEAAGEPAPAELSPPSAFDTPTETAAVEPPADADGVVVEAELLDEDGSVDVPGMTTPQSRALHRLLGKLNIKGDDRHPWATEQLGRPIVSLNEITHDEARRLIDAAQDAVDAMGAE